MLYIGIAFDLADSPILGLHGSMQFSEYGA